MKALSSAYAKGRINTAGCTLAVFFLVCLCFFTACPLNASDSASQVFPFAKESRLCLFDADSDNYMQCSLGDSFTQSGVAPSKKAGWTLAWNKKKGQLYHVNQEGKLKAKTSLSGGTAYVNKKYVLIQGSSFDQNKGFSFTLFSIKYTFGGQKIALKQLWKGSLDCFVSDSLFTADGVCIAGGSRDDTRHNVFYITASGIHKCFTMAKDSDFLRLISGGDNRIYAFLSQQKKIKKDAALYSFTLDGQPEQALIINLAEDPALPPDFDCFFGYGFNSDEQIILPSSLNGIINFLCYDPTGGKIARIVADAVGCVSYLGSSDAGGLYVARDPLIDGSFYGIRLFDGRNSGAICTF